MLGFTSLRDVAANLTYQDEYKNISASAPIGKIGDTYKLVFF
jgi:hypothetical protein